MNREENYKNVYQAMNAALKYYKKQSSLQSIDWEAVMKDGVKMVEESPIPLFMRDLFFAVEDQLGREESENKTEQSENKIK